MYVVKVGAHREGEKGQKRPQGVAVDLATSVLGHNVALVAPLVGGYLVLLPEPDCQQHGVLEQGQGHEPHAEQQPQVHGCQDPGLKLGLRSMGTYVWLFYFFVLTTGPL